MADGLHLNDAELAHLRGLGVTQDPDGTLRSSAGKEVAPGIAAKMLRWDGSLSVSVSRSEHRAALGALGKGTLDPGRFGRGYLTPGHAADSPAVTGHYNTAPVPGSDPAEPQDFTRSYLNAGHQKPSPDDRGDNSPVAPGSSGGTLYDSAAGAYNANRAQSRANHVAMTGDAASRPAPPQWSPSPDLAAADVPHAISVAATKPAPGERQ